MRLFTEDRSSNLSRARGVQSALLAELAGFVVLTKTGVARLLWKHRRLYDRRWRSVGGFAGVDAGISLALSDEGSGALLWDDLEVVGATGVCEIDGRRGPLAEDDGPLLLSHGDVLGVVVPVIAEGVDLSLKFVGDGRDEGIIGIVEEVTSLSEEGESLVAEEMVDLAPDKRSDGSGVGHSVTVRKE